MNNYGNDYDFGASGSSQHSSSEAYLYTEPNFHVPPTFLDGPPRGRDPSLGLLNEPITYQQQQQQDGGGNEQPWDYLQLQTGTTPTYGMPMNSGTNGNSMMYTDPYSLQQQYPPESPSSYFPNTEPTDENLSSFPGMSLEPTRSPSDSLDPARTRILGSSGSTPRSPPHEPGNGGSGPLADQSNEPPTTQGPLLYSASGFDMVGVLLRVASRENPQVILGPVDFTCSFVVSDATNPEEPIIYASPTFSDLTGYDTSEIVGRNCRFLQAPNGRVRKGETRRYTDDKGVAHIRKSLDNRQECQVSFINYRKNGEAFVNLVTIIPIKWDSDEIKYYVGFQVDLERQPHAILQTMRDGSYSVNYATQGANSFPPMSGRMKKLFKLTSTPEEDRPRFNDIILSHSDDFIHVVSLKGAFQYVSPSVIEVLEYTPEELMGKSITDIAHPNDVVPVMRELKDSSSQPQGPSMVSSSSLAQHYLSQAKLVSLLYRVRRKYSGFIWLESTGRLQVDSTKGRKSIVFSGRIRRIPPLPWGLITPDRALAEHDCWTQISIDSGLLLTVSENAEQVLGRPASEVQGTRLCDWVAQDVRSVVDSALAETRSKMNVKGATGETTQITCRRATPDAHPTADGETAPCITITFFSPTAESDAVASPGSLPAQPDVIKRGARMSTVVCHISLSRPTPAPSPPNSVMHSATHSTSVQDYLRAGSTTLMNGPPPSSVKSFNFSLTDNVYEELETTRGTSWQYELQQLRIANAKLQGEIDNIMDSKGRGGETATSNSGPKTRQQTR